MVPNLGFQEMTPREQNFQGKATEQGTPLKEGHNHYCNQSLNASFECRAHLYIWVRLQIWFGYYK
ncbi:rCG53132, partial [Rattus norvegicus]